MTGHSKRQERLPLPRLLAVSFFLLLALSSTGWAQTRTVVDAAGRSVEIPETIERALPAGPPASVALYTLAPEKLAGWVRALSDAERPYIAEPYRDLPVTGRLTGRGNTASIESIIAARPDVIIDVGSVDATYASLADRVQAQTGIPYLLIDGTLARTPDAYRILGDILGVPERAEVLATYAQDALSELEGEIAALPMEARPRVYYARGPEGLETGLAGSINVEVLDAVGATNVAAAAGFGGLTNVSPEQVLSWNPDVILTLDETFYASVADAPLWQGLSAVREGRVFRAPAVPFGWFDSPPGVNRLIGIRWLTAILYPDLDTGDLRTVTRDFYDRFYHVALDETALDTLLRDAVRPPS